MGDVPAVRISPKFCNPKADLTVRSSDGILFKVFSKDLAAFSEAFPPTEFAQLDTVEVVSLPEHSLVLELLFQFMQRQRQPSLTNVPFSIIAGLAEAVEKYEVFTASELCRLHMSAAATDSPVPVLGYASKHGLHDLSDLAASLTLGKPVKIMQTVLTDKALLAWFMYRENWVQNLTALGNNIRQGQFYTCSTMERFGKWLNSEVQGKLAMLKRVELGSKECVAIGCEECGDLRQAWKKHIQAFKEKSRKFSTYL